MSELDTLRWQFTLVTRLAAHHLPALTDDMCLWRPAPSAWTVRQDADGNWRPDWADVEPDPAPPATIGWITWHLIWWRSSLIAAARGETPPARESVLWPGGAAAAVAQLDSLTAEWSALLAALTENDLDRPIAYPWAEPQPLRRALAWANLELMKNIAEIGDMRRLYDASRG